MRVHDSIFLARADQAMAALTSREGASHFRDIKEYSAYEKRGHQVFVEYATMWGPTKVVLTPCLSGGRVTFRGTAPLGVTFGGSWTNLSGEVHLEQLVRGLPGFARPLVQRRVRRAMQDLKSSFSA